MKIGTKLIGNNCPTYIVAEMSANHLQNKKYALDIVRAAKDAGADAIKLQTYRPDTITIDSNKEDFLINKSSPWAKHNSIYQLFEKTYLPWEWHSDIFKLANKLNIDIFSAPFDDSAVDLLEQFNPCAYKIASPEITDIGLIKKCVYTNKPLILSLGCAELSDINLLIKTFEDLNFKDYIFLKCSASYPAPIDNLNLATISDIEERFNCYAGFSDHTLGWHMPIVAVSLGAKIIEKHIALDNGIETSDSFFSLKPREFATMVENIRKTEIAIGNVNYDIPDEVRSDMRGRRSLYFTKPMNYGEIITREHIKSVRPAWGLHPKFYEQLIGKKINRQVDKGDRVITSDLNSND